MPEVIVRPSTSAPYPVDVEVGAIAQRLRAHIPEGEGRIAIISDRHVAELHGLAVGSQLRSTGRPVDVLTFPEGERHKTRETKARLEDELAERRAGRDVAIVGLGGGVTTDLAGFVAATWMRGVSHVLLPTSLLAMVDAAIGGKTGVDTPAGKNLVGAFHQPAAVVVDPSVLVTLPREGIDCGLAEMVKHALVADPAHLEALLGAASHLDSDSPDLWTDHIVRSIEIKAAVVSEDDRERGRRAVLNLGHTIGHAIERAANFRVLHGHAVSVGMVAEARIAERLGLLAGSERDHMERALETLGLPTTLPVEVEPDSVFRHTATDKKGRGGRVRYSLLAGIGEPARADDGAWTQEVPDDVALSVLEELES